MAVVEITAVDREASRQRDLHAGVEFSAASFACGSNAWRPGPERTKVGVRSAKVGKPPSMSSRVEELRKGRKV